MGRPPEVNSVGVDPKFGHVHVLRRMSDSMRAEAASGKVPNVWHDSMYAGADNVAPRKPLNQLPPRLDAAALVDLFFDRILPLPSTVKALGHKVSLADVDKALSATGLAVADKIQIKNALSAKGFLLSADRFVSRQARL
jgi:hypothetical protein